MKIIGVVLNVDISDDVSLKATFYGYLALALSAVDFHFWTGGTLRLLEKEGIAGRAVAYSATRRALSRS